MSWSLFRWVWQLEGPLYAGIPPAGSLNRSRLYVPARALWGAMTAELSRREAQNGKAPQYQTVGESLQKAYRFTYLFPAEKSGTGWKAWLPTYREGVGTAWHREDDPGVVVISDRAFRRRLLFTRPGTSIDASTDAADDGSLRETECIEVRWRNDRGQDAGPVAMLGYVFIQIGKEKAKYSKARRRFDGLDTLFVGGDTRYGLGRLHRIAFERVTPERIFGSLVRLKGAHPPQIEAKQVWAHACADAPLKGGLELLGGWDRSSIRDFDQAAPLWHPGSKAENVLLWSIEPDGLWRRVGD